MSERDEFNAKIVEEFRANAGVVGGMFEGVPILLLHHTGARSGTVRLSPLAYQALGGGAWAIFGSMGGAPTHPAWVHNLRANPKARIEVGTETVDVVARTAEGDERERIFAKQKADLSVFATYEEKTKGIRDIPVIVLDRA